MDATLNPSSGRLCGRLMELRWASARRSQATRIERLASLASRCQLPPGGASWNPHVPVCTEGHTDSPEESPSVLVPPRVDAWYHCGIRRA